MNAIYNIALYLVERWLALYVFLSKRRTRTSKLSRFAFGQVGLLEHIESDMAASRGDGMVYWFHAASLGEYAIARPIIKRLKEMHGDGCRVVLTFFSSTGVDALSKRHDEIDYLYFLPLDSRRNVSRFLDAVRPTAAVFMVSEYWHNYLCQLHRRGIPTYLVSAVIHRRSAFFRWYGVFFRRMLRAYTHIFVLNDASRDNLSRLGCRHVTVTGDPLFDNAAAIAATPWHNGIVERFAGQGPLFVAGSIHYDQDMDMICHLANKHRGTRFIIIPHEISTGGLQRIRYVLSGKSLLYSECDANTDFSQVQVLIIDFIGALAYIYRYARMAYVGGGFTRLLHSVIEATVYGVPVAFGPRTHRKAVAQEMMRQGIGFRTPDYNALDTWYTDLWDDDERLQYIRGKAALYVSFNTGATNRISKTISQGTA